MVRLSMKRFLLLVCLLLLSRGPAVAQEVDIENLLQWTSGVGEMLFEYTSAFETALFVASSHTDDDLPEL